MLNNLLSQTNVPLLERLAAFTEKRQQVLAGNVANIDTPNYRMRDLPVSQFQSAMRDAVQAQQLARNPDPAIAAALPPAPAQSPLADRRLMEVREAEPVGVTMQDGNNRHVETQMLEMTKNAMRQSYAIELMNSQYAMLQMVLSSQ